MLLTILDRSTMGYDISAQALSELGTLRIFDITPKEKLLENIGESDIIITNKVKITREAIKGSGNLKLICVFATGYDNIDIEAAKEYGVAVCNVPGYSTYSVAMFTLAKVLSLATHLAEYSNYVKSGKYTDSGAANSITPVVHDLKGKTWGIVGYGNIGKAVGKIAEAMDIKVIVNKRTATDEFKCVDIDTLCRESDIISLHCPLNSETKGLIGPERINSMKDGVILVNEARGLVVDEEAIANAVLSGKIGGFGCDVYSEEPFSLSHPYNKISSMSNVILTPHTAWASFESRQRCFDIIAENITSFFNGTSKNRIV